MSRRVRVSVPAGAEALAAAFRAAGAVVADGRTTGTADGGTPDASPGAAAGAAVPTPGRPATRPDVVLLDTPLALRAADERSWVLPGALPALAALRAGDLPDAGALGRARWVLCGDEEQRALLEARVPEAARRTAVLPAGGAEATVRRLLDRTFPTSPPLDGRSAPLKVVVAGHDLGFLTGVVEHLRSLEHLELRIDHVAVFARHDEAASREHVRWADVVLCEWLSPVAAWYSRNRRPGQRVVVRLHRMELYNDWPEQVDIAGIDQVVCVSPHYRRLTLERTGWPADKVTCIPNYVDCDLFDRPKIPGAERALGFVGVVPARKRLDLALDVLERLRADDPAWTLFVKTKLWWQYPWSWRNPDERTHAREVLRRIQGSPLLADAVVFDEHGADVPAWMRKIGWVLSTSDDESFHLSPAEGMASGAVPVVRAWPGSDTIYDRRWVRQDVDDMVAWIRGCDWAAEREYARAQVRASIDLPAVCARFVDVLLGDLPGDAAGETLARVPAAAAR